MDLDYISKLLPSFFVAVNLQPFSSGLSTSFIPSS